MEVQLMVAEVHLEEVPGVVTLNCSGQTFQAALVQGHPSFHGGVSSLDVCPKSLQSIVHCVGIFQERLQRQKEIEFVLKCAAQNQFV
jgi:hypothetical protein